MSMSAEGSSLRPDSFFARVFGRYCTLFAKQSAPPAPHGPGPWTEYAMTVPWKVARNARKLKTRAIVKRKQATPVREPLQRSTTHYTGKRLDERIGRKAANFESILIQIWEKYHNKNAQTVYKVMDLGQSVSVTTISIVLSQDVATVSGKGGPSVVISFSCPLFPKLPVVTSETARPNRQWKFA
ncbi:hypothetical protein N7455_011590 [Penicillium solitum]|uniref:uncharacterized protein n=1 Tax=Penicillium solitum TaxID=60172 RepID=UPI0032C41D84|nr:hypothetical protein N7455_011590 [Penicillium solitum]